MMQAVVSVPLLFLVAVLSLTFALYLFLRPPTKPEGIPAVPFWVALIPFFKDVDQSETFKTYIETPLRTHGAVKLFFGARWNVVVHRPEYLAELFKHEDIYQKSGNQEKIPHSVLAAFLGDNIISSRGGTWRQYKQVIQPGLQRTFEVDTMFQNATKLGDLINAATMAEKGHGILVQDLLQRYTIANIGQVVLQTDFQSLEHADANIHTLQKEVKRQIFKPMYMNFPFLDRLPIPSRQAARNLVSRFKEELMSSLVRSHEKDPAASSSSDKLGARLLAARTSGQFTEKQFRDNLTVLYVAGQENPQIGLISTLYLFAKHPEAQERLHQEILAVSGLSSDPLPTATPQGVPLLLLLLLQDMPYLTSAVYESLRLLPPLSQLINRRAARGVRLGGGGGDGDGDAGVYIPAGTYLGYHGYSTHRDAAYWGADAARFRPERWGGTAASVQKLYRQKRASAQFIAFHGGSRACLGERFALLELRVTLFVLARRFTWRLDPAWPDRMTPAGPLFPRNLKLVFSERKVSS